MVSNYQRGFRMNILKFLFRRLLKRGIKMDEKEINSRIENRKYYTPSQFDEFVEEIGDNFKLLGTNKKIKYYNIPCSFDIETTSFMNGKEKQAITYEWTLGINWVVMIGRTWDEFMEVTNRLVEHFWLNDKRRLIIYVHNLSFEFQFFRKLFDWERVFSLEERKPIQAITTDGIEFRCSYLLSGYSLANLGDQLMKYKVSKMVGDLDYDLIRTPITPLTDKEIGYCLCDVYVVMAYIQELIEREGDITKLPLTKTGFVRKYCRNNCYYTDKTHRKDVQKYRAYRNLMMSLTIEPEEYRMLKDAFMGGFTHANPYFSRGIFTGVSSYDFTSSYPAVMISEKFPMSKGEFVEIKSMEEFAINLNCYCCVFDIKFTKLRPKVDFENYLSVSHCRKLKNYKDNNGRIISADYLETTITELDYFIIDHFYDWDECEICTFIRYKKDYLPTDFVKSILDLYVDKTTLKGVEGRELDYLLSKERINSCFGMCVTDICRDEIVYDEIWGKEKPELENVLEKYNNSKNRFLSYAWGIYVTAYARYNLFTGICEFENDYIYSDTDSIKVINADNHKEYFDMYNGIIRSKLQTAMKHHKLDISMCSPKTIKGEEKPLGVWDYEGTYRRFKTIGAKRYMYEREDGSINLTVSGLNKVKAVPYMLEKFGDKIFENFDNCLYIPHEHTGKLTHTYLDNEMYGEITDHLGGKYLYHEWSGVHLGKADYSLSITQNYLNYLLDIKEV